MQCLKDTQVIFKIDVNDISNVNTTTVLTGNTFKNIDELQKCTNNKKVILFISHLKPSAIKDYLSMWVYESYYLKQSMCGNLTNRIKNINNGICYSQIMKRCFDAYDIKKNMSSTSILDTKTTSIVKELHDICPSMCGSFIDYLIRRIICELTKKPFSDSRTNKILNPDNSITYYSENDTIWEYVKNDDYGDWLIKEEPKLTSKKVGEITEGGRFIAYEMCNEWLKIKYKNVEGWVRWKLPKLPNGPIKDIECHSDPTMNIENKYIQRVKRDNIHICSRGCKYDIEQSIFRAPECINTCSLETCQYISYEKVKNTELYLTKDILYDIFAISLCHTEAFGYCPKQEKFNTFHNKLKDIDDLVGSLTEMCKTLIHDKIKILLNPALGGPLNKLENISIPSDADLVIDDIIYDIKCTRTNSTGKEYYELLQLLGYSGLLLLNKKFNHRINNMIILNILEGTSTKYNISYLKKDNFIKYIKRLTNTDT